MRWWLVVLAWLWSPALFAAANSLEIESVNASVNVTAGTAFSVVVRSKTGGAYQPVDADRTITLSLKTGTGSLTGTLTGVIQNATDTVTISGVLYNRAEENVIITATVTTGSALTAADSPQFDVIPGVATQVVFAQAPAGAVSGAAFTTQPILEVRDAQGNRSSSVLDASQSLTLTVHSGGGTLIGTDTIDVGTAAGTPALATFSGLRIDLAGNMTLRASVKLGAGATVTADSSFTVAPGTANHFVVTGASPQQAGSSQTVTITAKDAAGNTATGFTGAQALVFSGASTSTGGSVPTATNLVPTAINFGASTNVTFSNGVGTSDVVLTAVETALLVATQGGITTSGADRLSVTVTPGAATVLVFSAAPSGAVAGAAFTGQPTVVTRDGFGNASTVGLLSPTTVTVSLLSGTGSLQGTLTGNVESGSLTFSDLRLDVAGTNRQLRATATMNASARNGDSGAFAVSPTTATALAFSVAPSGAVAGAAFTGQPTVVTRDVFGNASTVGLLSPTTVTVSLLSGTGPLQGTLTGNVESGSLTFSDLRLDVAGTNRELRATATLNAVSRTGDSGTFTVTPAAATVLAFTVTPSGAVAGAAFTGQPTVVTRDAFGNPSTVGLLSPTTVTVSLLSGTGPLQGTLTGNVESGSLTFSNLRLDIAGAARELRATATMNALARTGDSGAFTVSPTTATVLAFSVAPSGAVAGAAFSGQPTVVTRDQFGNASTVGLLSPTTVTVSLLSGTGPLQGVLTGNVESGSLTFTDLRLDIAGANRELRATATLNAVSRTGDSGAFTVSPTTATALAFTVAPSGAVAGAAFTGQPTVVTRDQFGNASTVGLLSPTTVTVSLLSGTGPLQGTLTGDVASGSLTFSNLRLDVVGSNRELRATATINASTSTSDSGLFSVSPAAATVLLFTVDPSGAVAGAAFTGQPTVVTRDAFGNPSTVGLVSPTTVTMSLLSGTGPLQGTVTGDVASGSLTFSNLRLDIAGSLRTLRATATMNAVSRTGDSGAFVVSPTTATALAFAVAPSGAVAGAAFTGQPTVVTRDQFGNASTVGLLSPTTVTLSLLSGTGPLQGTLTGNVESGSLTFSDLRLDVAGANRELRATATLSAVSRTGDSGVFTVTPAAATVLTFTVAPSGAVAGAAFTGQPTVVTRDAFGNASTTGLVSPTTVTVALLSGTGPLLGTVTGDVASGSLTFSDLRLDVAGASRELRATALMNASSRTGDSGTFTVSPAAATVLAFTVAPTGAVAGAPFSGQPTVVTRDGFGNASTVGLVSPTTVTMSLLSGTGPLQGTVTGDVASGSLTFSNLRLDIAGNNRELRATATMNAVTRTGDSGTFTVSPTTATVLAFSVAPSGAVAGAAFTGQPTVVTRDVFGNASAVGLLSPTTVTVSLLSGTGPLLGTLTGDVASGSLTFSDLRLDVTGTDKELRASAIINSVACTGDSGLFSVSAGALDHFVLSGVSSQIAGAAQSVTIRALDASGNVTPAFTGAQTLVMSGASLSSSGAAPTAANLVSTAIPFGSGTVMTFTSGVSTTDIVLVQVETALLVATQGGITTSGADRLAVVVSPADATVLAFNPSPSAAVAGAAFTGQPTIVTRDVYGNASTVGLVTPVTVSLSLLSGSGPLQGTLSGNIASGALVFSDLRIDVVGNKQVRATATLNGSLRTGDSAVFTVTPAAATVLVFSPEPSGAVAGAAFTGQPTVLTHDVFGNTSTVGLVSPTIVTVSLIAGTGPLQGTVTGDVTSGSLTFTDLRIDVTGTDKQLQASATMNGAVRSVATGAFTVLPGAAQRLVVQGPAITTAAVDTALVFRVEDAFGNLATTFTQGLTVDVIGLLDGTNGEVATLSDENGVAQAVSGGANAALQFVAGVASATEDPDQAVLRAMRAGTYSLTATGGVLVAGTALVMTVNTGASAKVLVTAVGNTTPTAGEATTVDVVLQDAGGNIAPASTPVNLVLSSSPTLGSLRTGYVGARVDTAASTTTITNVILDHAESGVVLTIADGASVLASGNGPTMTVNNDQPVLTIGSGDLTYAGGSGAVPFGLPGIAVSDVNSAGFTPFFAGASATVTITGGLIAGEDLLQVRSAGLVSVTGTTIRYNANPIATVTGGLAGAPLVVNFTTAFADRDAMAAVLENLCYHNVGGVSPTTGLRTLSLAFNDGSSAVPGGALAALPVTRAVDVVTGNALPVLVANTGLSVTRGSTITITTAALQVIDEESGPSALIYQVVTFPQRGDLWLGSAHSAQKLAPGGVTSFTQADIDGNLLQYEHGGGTEQDDSFAVAIEDGTNSLPLTTVTIVVPGANLNPRLFLPSTTLTWTEGAVPSVIDPSFNSTLVLDSDTFDFGGGTVDIEIVDDDDQADAHTGDRLSVGGAGLGTPPMASIDPTLTGVGKALRLALLTGTDGLGAPLSSAQAVARLIGSLQFASVSDDPPTRARYLRITLTEAAPSTALGVATLTLVVNAVNDPPVFSFPQVGTTLVLKAVAGVALRTRVLADDVDLPLGAALTYNLVSISPPSAGVATVNLASGSLTFTPLATFSGTVDLVVRATDNLGAATPDTVVQVNVLAGPTSQGPLVVSDPPFESYENQILSYAMVIRPDPTLGAIPATSVTVDLVGDLPPGAQMDVGVDQTHPVLTAPLLVRPGDGVYTFGLRVEVDYGGVIGKKVGYQPVTFKIRALGAAN